MIRILQVLKELDSGGIQSFVYVLYQNIDRQKVQFDFVVHQERSGMYEKMILKLGAKIYRFKTVKQCGGRYGYKKQWECFWKAHGDEYGVVHAHYMSHEGMIAETAKKYGKKVICHSHSNSPSKYINLAYVLKKCMNFHLSQKADLMLACSQAAGRDFFGADFEERGIVLKNGIPAEQYTFNLMERNRMRAEFHLENRLVIGHVGNYVEHKNQDFMLSVFAEISKRRQDAIFVWCGYISKNDMAHIETLLKKYAIQDKVMLVGRCDCINNWMQAFDVFLFPSLYEGLGIALIEAQASGLICIISDTIPQEAVVTDLIVRCKLGESEKQWADKLLTNCVYDRGSQREAIIKAGFDIKEVARFMEDTYLKLYKN